MTFGIFADDGKLEGDFHTQEEAVTVLGENYSPDDEAHVAEECPDHPDHERASCEQCNEEMGECPRCGEECPVGGDCPSERCRDFLAWALAHQDDPQG